MDLTDCSKVHLQTTPGICGRPYAERLLRHCRFIATSEAVEVRQHYDERLHKVLLQTLLLMRCLQESDRPFSYRSMADVAVENLSVKSVSTVTWSLLACLLESTLLLCNVSTPVTSGQWYVLPMLCCDLAAPARFEDMTCCRGCDTSPGSFDNCVLVRVLQQAIMKPKSQSCIGCSCSTCLTL